MSTLTRSEDDIIARYRAVKADDWLGFKADVLLSSVGFDAARPFLKASAKAEDWDPPVRDADLLREQAMDYLAFAFGKASDHRGISASRSVDKLTEFAWLLGRDDVVSAMDEADYAQYGVPALCAFARGFDMPIPDGADIERMSRGLPCRDGCEDGCGR